MDPAPAWPQIHGHSELRWSIRSHCHVGKAYLHDPFPVSSMCCASLVCVANREPPSGASASRDHPVSRKPGSALGGDVERYQSNSNASAIDIVVEKRPVGLKLVKARCDPISIFLCGPILCVIIVIVAILIICAVGYSILNGSIKF